MLPAGEMYLLWDGVNSEEFKLVDVAQAFAGEIAGCANDCQCNKT